MPKRTFTVLASGGGSAVLEKAKKRLAAKRSFTANTRGRIAKGFTRRSGFYGRFDKGGELKFFDTSISFTADATGEVPATGQLNLIPQGVTESTRVGRKCTLKSVQLLLNATYAPGAAATAVGNVTLMLVQDTQANGAAAAITDLLTGTNATTDMRNAANFSRFRVLKRWDLSFNSFGGVTTAYNNVIKHIDFYRKVNIPLEFSSTTGAIGEIRTNNVFLVAGSTAPADDLTTFAGNCRVRFSDD